LSSRPGKFLKQVEGKDQYHGQTLDGAHKLEQFSKDRETLLTLLTVNLDDRFADLQEPGSVLVAMNMITNFRQWPASPENLKGTRH
jgi:hypothetical protein